MADHIIASKCHHYEMADQVMLPFLIGWMCTWRAPPSKPVRIDSGNIIPSNFKQHRRRDR
uniref:Uncharacterized protein n=1 Tax=Arion vulgaris TaxID=1028688 RepID=A0A0B6Z6W2_9EUPU